MKNTPFKMRGFSGFGNSPLKDDTKKKKLTTEQLLAIQERKRNARIKRRMSKYNVSEKEAIRREEEIEGMTREEKDKAGIM